jgi:magnesium-transporting ATPase (P-type)
MFPALALGMEKPEPDVMNRPPRPRDQPLIDSRLLWRAFGWLGLMEAALCFAGFLSIFMLTGHTAEIGLPMLAALPIPASWKFSLSFHQATLLATTIYHAGVVTAQVGNVLACRSERMRGSSLGWLSNKYLWLGIIIELLGITGMIYIPFLARIFNHVSLPAWMWIGLVMNTLVIYSVEWVHKLVKRGIEKHSMEKPSTLTLQEVT